MEMSTSIGNIAKALSQFQSEVKAPGKNAVNPQYNSKYSTLDDCIAAIKEVAPKYGLSYFQSIGSSEGMVSVTTMVMHESNEWIKSDPLWLPALQVRKGGATEFSAQGAGIGATYGRRYGIVAAFGLASEEDDDAAGIEGRNVEMIQAVTLGTCKVLLEDMVNLGGERDKILSAIKAEVGTSLFEQMTKDQGNAIVKKMEVWKAKMMIAPKGD